MWQGLRPRKSLEAHRSEGLFVPDFSMVCCLQESEAEGAPAAGNAASFMLPDAQWGLIL